ncbi:MAG: hypothetical protein K0R38_7771 [Polyangiaceae bacterium]|nr:hypothetical protein [Polyangiaceae bacterium]
MERSLEASCRHPIRAEWHTAKAEFLDGLSVWSREADRNGAMLLINAHMGEIIAPQADHDAHQEISWAELAPALGGGVHTLWLLGCNSDAATQQWSAVTSPVAGYILATSKTGLFFGLLPLFAAELSLSPIRSYPQMLTYLQRKQPDLEVDYWFSDGTRWIAGTRAETPEYDDQVAAAQEQLRAAFHTGSDADVIESLLALQNALHDQNVVRDWYADLAQRLPTRRRSP